MQLKLSKIVNSVGLVLPKEARDRMKVTADDIVYLTETPEGCALTPYDPDFASPMDAARNIMKRRRGALHELAK